MLKPWTRVLPYVLYAWKKRKSQSVMFQSLIFLEKCHSCGEWKYESILFSRKKTPITAPGKKPGEMTDQQVINHWAKKTQRIQSFKTYS